MVSSEWRIEKSKLSQSLFAIRHSLFALSLRSSHALRLIDRTAALGPVLERAEVIDLVVAHVLEHLAGKRRAPARGAIDDERLVLGKILVVIGRLRIGAAFQHAARDVHGAADLAARRP